MKWHNAKAEERARQEPELRAALRRERYWKDPEAARERMRKWREAHPDLQQEYEKRSYEKNAEARRLQAARWREDNRQHLRDRANLDHYRVRKNAPWQHILRSRRRWAAKEGIPFALTPEWAEARWTGKCELTGLPFVLTNTVVGFYSPSIDKIEPTRGYLPDNCRFILFAVNSFKGTGTDVDLLLTAQALVKRLLYRNGESSSV